jgi:hypothetical protein
MMLMLGIDEFAEERRVKAQALRMRCGDTGPHRVGAAFAA